MFDNPIYNYPIEALLSHFGSREESKGMFYSPLREETSASLHVNRKDNVWFDHGAGIGGTNVQLVMAVRKCSTEEAEQFIKSLDPALAAKTEAITKARSLPTTEIIKVKPIWSYYLKRYLEERKIPINIADRYCKEVIIRNHVKGKDYTTLGFENNSGGYNLSAPYGFKSCSKGALQPQIRNVNVPLCLQPGLYRSLKEVSTSCPGRYCRTQRPPLRMCWS